MEVAPSACVQVLVKSCKMVPVMVMGTLLHNRRYSPAEYVCMTLIGVRHQFFLSVATTP
jgi:hypothetical protein